VFKVNSFILPPDGHFDRYGSKTSYLALIKYMCIHEIFTDKF